MSFVDFVAHIYYLTHILPSKYTISVILFNLETVYFV